MSDLIIAAIIGALASLTASGLINLIAWKKAKPEIRKTTQDGHASEADAAETALRSTELAIKQMAAMQDDLYQERDKRRALEQKFSDLEIEFVKMAARVGRLESQVKSLGAEPVK